MKVELHVAKQTIAALQAQYVPFVLCLFVWFVLCFVFSFAETSDGLCSILFVLIPF